jgi:hypothetical protein
MGRTLPPSWFAGNQGPTGLIMSLASNTLPVSIENWARAVVNMQRNTLMHLKSTFSPGARRVAQARGHAETLLGTFSQAGPSSPLQIDGAVMIDGIWDNIAHWLRYAVVRNALGLAHNQEVMVLGQHNRQRGRNIVRAWGMSGTYSFSRQTGDRAKARRDAMALLDRLETGTDVLTASWPGGVPGDVIYDDLLRRQRASTLDLAHPRMLTWVSEFCLAVQRAEVMFETNKIGLVVLSHIFPLQHAAIACAAIARGIPVILIYSGVGTFRAIRVNETNSFYRYSNLPDVADLVAWSPQKHEQLRAVGHATDLGAVYAFSEESKRLTRAQMCERFGWPTARPIIAIYTSQWFDTPHAYGMKNFRDFLDWTEVTLETIRSNTEASWLIKPHPIEKWYGGIGLRDVVQEPLPGHMGIADEWHGSDVNAICDGLVTVHGTAGLEFAGVGKPVLLAERGWYGDFGVGVQAPDRDGYIDLLSRAWWTGFDSESATSAAEQVAGLLYGVPAELDDLRFPHDSAQDALSDGIVELVREKTATLEAEASFFRDWFLSDAPTYHAYKMQHATRYGETS